MKIKTRITPTLVLTCTIILVRQLFSFPVHATRSGPLLALAFIKQDLVSTWRYHLWQLGVLPTGITTRNVVHSQLDDGRRVSVHIILLGDKVSLAFIRPRIEKNDLGLFYVRHRLAPTDPIELRAPTPFP